MALDGIQDLLADNFRKTDKIHFVRSADDFIITGRSPELLETCVKPLIEGFLRIRGLELSEEKTMVKNKKGLNDDGDDTNIKSISQKVKQLRAQIMADPKLSQADSYKKMIKQIDIYWEKLFADPITIETANGQISTQPQRTNNILERFFRELKRRNRKRSGSISLNKRLKTMLTDTPLIKNLDNAEYMNAILDGHDTLEKRFGKIDCNMVVEKLKAEQKSHGKISPEMKKIIHRPNLPEELVSLFAV